MNTRSKLRRCTTFACMALLVGGAASFAADPPVPASAGADTFQIDPVLPTNNNPAMMTPSLLCELTSKHLKLKPGVSVHQVRQFGGGEKYAVLTDGNVQGTLYEPGEFFEAIDTPEKAADLALLSLQHGQLIKSAAQYKAIVNSLKRIPDWKPADFLKIEAPAAGVTVVEVPGQGYRVSILAFEFDSNYRELGFRDITLHQFTIARDGRMGRKYTVCLRAPERPTPSKDPNAKFFTPEFGLNGSPATAATESAAVKAYNAAINKALTPDGTLMITPAYKVTDRKSLFPFPMADDYRYEH